MGTNVGQHAALAHRLRHDAAGKQRLLAHMQPGNAGKTTSAPVNAVLAVDNRYHDQVPRLLSFRPEMRETLDGNDAWRERIRDLSGAMQAAYFIIAVRAAGPAAGPLRGFHQASLDADLLPDGQWSSILVVNVGHPGQNAWFDRLPRLDYEEAVHTYSRAESTRRSTVAMAAEYIKAVREDDT